MFQSLLKMGIIAGMSLFLLLISRPFAQGEEVEKAELPGAPEDYLIGPGDVLEISVWRNEALSRVVVVRPDGKVSLPLMGELNAAGHTPLELRDQVIAKLKEFAETPEATVIVQQVNSYAVYVVGEVVRPGRYQLYGKATMVQALAMAGGFTGFASVNKITLRRMGKGKDGEHRITVQYKDIISGDKGDIWLKPGDTIIVP